MAYETALQERLRHDAEKIADNELRQKILAFSEGDDMGSNSARTKVVLNYSDAVPSEIGSGNYEISVFAATEKSIVRILGWDVKENFDDSGLISADFLDSDGGNNLTLDEPQLKDVNIDADNVSRISYFASIVAGQSVVLILRDFANDGSAGQIVVWYEAFSAND